MNIQITIFFINFITFSFAIPSNRCIDICRHDHLMAIPLLPCNISLLDQCMTNNCTLQLQQMMDRHCNIYEYGTCICTNFHRRIEMEEEDFEILNQYLQRKCYENNSDTFIDEHFVCKKCNQYVANEWTLINTDYVQRCINRE